MRATILLGAAAALALAACNNNGAGNTANSAAGANAAPPPPAANAAPTPAAAPATPQAFVTTAAISDMYEIAAGKIARTRSKDAKVKAFAAKMIHDHTASTAALKKAIAGDSTLSPPTAMDDQHKQMIAALNAASALNFDKTYMDQQVSAHQDAVNLFQAESASTGNAALAGFASTTLPVIQGHLSMAQQIDSGLQTSPTSPPG